MPDLQQQQKNAKNTFHLFFAFTFGRLSNTEEKKKKKALIKGICFFPRTAKYRWSSKQIILDNLYIYVEKSYFNNLF